MALGLFADSKIDFEIEGLNFYQKIVQQPDNFKMNYFPFSENLNQIKVININESCKDPCVLSKTEIVRLEDELLKQSIYMDRLKKIVTQGPISCDSLNTLNYLKSFTIYKLMNNLLLDYKLQLIKKSTDDITSQVLKLDSFLVNSLKNHSYNLATTLMLTSLLDQSRMIIKDYIGLEKIKVTLEKINFEQVVKNIIHRELKEIHFLINNPFENKLELMEIITSESSYSESKDINTVTNGLNHLFNFFLLKNKTLNDSYDLLQKASWDPCLSQTDIQCKSNTKSYIALRNPAGNFILVIQSETATANLLRIKNNVNKINNISKLL